VWTSATPYPIPIVRYGFAQVGNSFYVIGGVSNGTRVANVNRYDVGTGIWTALANIPVASEAPTCAYNSGANKIYCAEGDTGSSFQIYNIPTNTWSAGPPVPGAANRYGAASGSSGNLVYIVGGSSSIQADVQVYNIGTNTWSAGSSAANALLLAGYQPVGQFLYVVGGFSSGGPLSRSQDIYNASSVVARAKGTGRPPLVPFANNTTTLRLDMSTGTWSTGPAFTPARADFGLAHLGGILYALAGDATGGGFFDSTSLVDSLSVGGWPGGSWASAPPVLPTHNRQANQAGFSSTDGRIWSTGGIDGATFVFYPDHIYRTQGSCGTPTPTPPVVTATRTNTVVATATCVAGAASWRTETSMATGRRNPAVAVVGSFLYAASGFNAAPDYTNVLERFDGSAWTTLAPIPTPGAQMRASSVGTNMYVPGGYNSISFTGPLNSMQIYTTTTNTWGQGATLPGARSGPAVVTFNNKVYIISGYTTPFPTGTNSVIEYDPATNTYATKANMPALNGNVGGALYNGEIYVIGGGVAPAASYAYNPTTDVWRTLAPFPVTTCQSDAVFALDGKIWVVGCLGATLPNQVYVYDPVANSYSLGTTYTVDHQGPGAANFLGRGYVVGGGAAGGGSAAVESLGGGSCGTATPTIPAQTPTRTATQGTGATATPTCPSGGGGGTPGPWATAAPITTDEYGGSSTSDGTYLYVAGGYSFSLSGQITQFGRYNPASNAWTYLTPVPDINNGLASSVYAPNVNKIFIFGGDDATTGVVVNTTRIYDIATGLWSTGMPMPDVRAFMASGYFSGKIYLVGGYSTGNISPAFLQTWEYDPVANTFATKNPIPAAAGFGGAGFGVIGGHLYVAGGRDANNVVIGTVWDYNIAADAWTARAPMLSADNVPGSGVIGGKLYVFGGGNPFSSDNPSDKRAFPIAPKNGSGSGSGSGNAGSASGNGSAPKASQPRTTNQVQVYDPGTNSWSMGNSLLQQRSFPSGTNVGSSYLIAVGGYTGTSTTTSVEVATAQGGGGCTTPTPTRTGTPPTSTPTACITNYSISSSTGATIVPGTTDIGSHCDDCNVPLPLPFAFSLYGQSFNTVNVDSNGNMGFVAADDTFTNTCLPDAVANYAIFPHWDDLCTGPCATSTCTSCGVFSSVSGTAPNRIFNIEWRANYYNPNTAIRFEVRL